MNTVTQPVAPRIAARLEVWDEDDTADEVDLDQVEVVSADLTEATELNTTGSVLSQVFLSGVKLAKTNCTDTRFSRLEAAGLRTYKAQLQRVVFENCRMTGADFAEANFEDCVFRNVKLDEAGFRFSRFKRVQFEDCILTNAEFNGAYLNQVKFNGCTFENTSFSAVNCVNVDISDEDITAVRGIVGLKGATISSVQLQQIAPLLAAELGFNVTD